MGRTVEMYGVLWGTGAIHPSAHDHYMTVPDMSRHKEATSLEADLLYNIKCPQSLSPLLFILHYKCSRLRIVLHESQYHRKPLNHLI